MYKRRELWFADLLPNCVGNAQYQGANKRVLIASNDQDNGDSLIPAVAVIPRRTGQGKIRDAFPGTLESPWNERGCDRKGVFDCQQILTVFKSRHGGSRLKDRIECLPPSRMTKVEELLSLAMARRLPEEVLAAVLEYRERHVDPLRRSALVTILDDHGAMRPAMVLGNDELRHCSPFPLAIIVCLRELDDLPVNAGLWTIIRLNKKTGHERRFVVLPRTVFSADIYLDVEEPNCLDPASGPMFPDTETEKAVLAVERYLAIGI